MKKYLWWHKCSKVVLFKMYQGLYSAPIIYWSELFLGNLRFWSPPRHPLRRIRISQGYCRFQGHSHPGQGLCSLCCPHGGPGALGSPRERWSRQTVALALANLLGPHSLAPHSQGSSHWARVTLPAGARPRCLSSLLSCLPWGPSEVTWGSNKAYSSSPCWRC